MTIRAVPDQVGEERAALVVYLDDLTPQRPANREAIAAYARVIFDEDATLARTLYQRLDDGLEAIGPPAGEAM